MEQFRVLQQSLKDKSFKQTINIQMVEKKKIRKKTERKKKFNIKDKKENVITKCDVLRNE